MTTNRTLVMCLLLALIAFVSSGCGDDAVRAKNFPPQLTSIGPVAKSGDQVTVDFSIRDAEGDDQQVTAELCEATDQGTAGTCLTPSEGTASDGMSLVPTTPADTDVPHRFAWAVGCGLGDGDCQSPSPSTEYLFRLSADDGGTVITSATFTLQALGFSSVPGCQSPQERVISRPEACR